MDQCSTTWATTTALPTYTNFAVQPFAIQKKVALPPIKVFGKKSFGIDFGPDFEFRSNPAENVSESCQLKILRSYPRPRREILIFSDPVKNRFDRFSVEVDKFNISKTKLILKI